MANFDPRRIYDENELQSFVPVTLYQGDEELGTVQMPREAVEGKSEKEVINAAFRAFQRLKAAEEGLDRKQIREMAKDLDIHDVLCLRSAWMVASNAVNIYIERAQEDEKEGPIAEKAFPADDEGLQKWIESLVDRIKKDLLGLFTENPSEAEKVYDHVWKHVIAWAAEDMEKDLGTKTVQAMPGDEFDAKLNEYIFEKQDFGRVADMLMDYYAQDLARLYLEALDPEGLPLEKLRRFLGFVARKDKDGLLLIDLQMFDAGAETAEKADPSLLSDLLQNRNLNVFSSPDYHALREALARKDLFREVEGVPWPTAFLDKGGVRGRAHLRPAAVENQPLMSLEEVDAWAKMMWQQREELSDLDADALDALSAIWLAQARSVNDDAIADVDELLAMRGLQPKKSGQGRRGGYRPEQRAQMLQALSHIQNIWLDMAEVDVYEDTGKGKKRRTKQAIQSRPFVITDRMGQIRLDGYMDVQRFIFRPGKVFARFLMREGRQTALLSAKALHFDPYRQKWEKRLTRYLSWQWRTQAYNGQYMRPYRVATLLEQVGEAIDKNAPSRTRERFEKALDTLQSEGVIGAWQYDRWDEDAADKRGWAKRWEQATVLIEPPDEIRDHYQASIEKPVEGRKQQAHSDTLSERVKARRKMLRLSQLQAAEQIGISQALLSQIERGRKPSSATQKKLEAWLSQAG